MDFRAPLPPSPWVPTGGVAWIRSATIRGLGGGRRLGALSLAIRSTAVAPRGERAPLRAGGGPLLGSTGHDRPGHRRRTRAPRGSRLAGIASQTASR